MERQEQTSSVCAVDNNHWIVGWRDQKEGLDLSKI